MAGTRKRSTMTGKLKAKENVCFDKMESHSDQKRSSIKEKKNDFEKRKDISKKDKKRKITYEITKRENGYNFYGR